MRTISELLTILRDNANVYGDGEIIAGLCYEVIVLYDKIIISLDERYALNDYIDKNMPTGIRTVIGIKYGWPPGEWPPRLAWLNEHIELTKDQQQ